MSDAQDEPRKLQLVHGGLAFFGVVAAGLAFMNYLLPTSMAWADWETLAAGAAALLAAACVVTLVDLYRNDELEAETDPVQRLDDWERENL